MISRDLRLLPYVAFLFPFDLLAAAALLSAEAIGRAVKACNAVPLRYRAKPQGLSDRRSASITVIVLNWDGRHLLEESLPPLINAVAGEAEILVVDNGSSDGSVEFVRERFPSVSLLELDKNYGFTGGNNRGAGATRSDIVVFLNNDMIVQKNFLRPLIDGFSDPSVFAVTSQIFFPDAGARRSETGNTRASFKDGFFSLAHIEVESAGLAPVFWAGGGSSAMDRARFLEIGGFDPLYHPFYVEDMDLSYQAWKRGWKSLIAPDSHVVHKHRATSRPKFGNRFVDSTIERNRYLFVWKNLTDTALLLEHILNLPRIHIRAMREHDPATELQVFFRALARLPRALARRIMNRSKYVLSDREVLRRIPQP